MNAPDLTAEILVDENGKNEYVLRFPGGKEGRWSGRNARMLEQMMESGGFEFHDLPQRRSRKIRLSSSGVASVLMRSS